MKEPCAKVEFFDILCRNFLPSALQKKGGTPQIRAVPPMHKGWLSRLINYHFCRISQNLDEICSLLH